MKTNTILIGPIGSGKNWCCRTLLAEYPDATGRVRRGVGKQVFMLAAEPGWQATNGDLTCGMGFHVHEHLPYAASIDEHMSWLDLIAPRAAADIKDMKLSSAIKLPYTRAYYGLFSVMNKFVCDVCGEDFGPVSAWDRDNKFIGWGDDRALVFDGLTGLSKMSIHFVAGPKPTITWPELDAAQHQVDDFIGLCVSIRASFILIAHWTREPREVEGGTGITVDTIGQKQAPKVLKPFDEVIVCRRDINKYSWNTIDVDNMHVDQKARRLPYSANIEPNFAQIFRDEIHMPTAAQQLAKAKKDEAERERFGLRDEA